MFPNTTTFPACSPSPQLRCLSGPTSAKSLQNSRISVSSFLLRVDWDEIASETIIDSQPEEGEATALHSLLPLDMFCRIAGRPHSSVFACIGTSSLLKGTRYAQSGLLICTYLHLGGKREEREEDSASSPL